MARVQAELFNAAGGDVLGTLDRVNAALDEQDLADRVLERVEQSRDQEQAGIPAE